MKSCRSLFILFISLALVVAATIPFKGLQWSSLAQTTGLTVGRNVNMVSGLTLPDGDPTLNRQNEVWIAASTRNPFKLLAVCNDYRSLELDLFLDEPPGENIPSYDRDAWGGVFQSHDGGATWSSTLLPGARWLNQNSLLAQSSSSPLATEKDADGDPLLAVADLCVQPSTNGLFQVSGIAFYRGTEEADRNGNVLFNARYLDYNNRENTDTIVNLDTKIVVRAQPDEFIDKAVCAVQLPSGAAHTIDIDGKGQIIPVSNVYIAYTVFKGSYEDGTLEGQIWITVSEDCGESWTGPFQLSSGHLDQGASIAVDPRGNGHVVVSWRRFEKTKPPYTQNEVEGAAIMAAVSTNAGESFSQVVEVASFAPGSDALFDNPQVGDGNITSFRANAYPFATMDGKGNTYLVYAQRQSGPEAWSRIMIATAGNDFVWSAPKQALSENHEGHEFWPNLAFSGDMLMMSWWDQRFDRGFGNCPPSHNYYYIQDEGNCMHALDVRVAKAEPTLDPMFSNSVQVSRYPFKVDLSTNTAKQLSDNWANLRLYNKGWWSFNGDYGTIAPNLTFVPKFNGWEYNSNYNPGTMFHAAWTDSRDVDVLGVFTNYTPPNTPGGLSQQTPCSPSGVGVRNQNIYTAPVSTTGIVVGSPANTKPLDIRRAFVVIVRNTTEQYKSDVVLEIDSTGPDASFWKAGQKMDGNLVIDIPPYSTVANTVVVEPHSNPHKQLTINVKENGSVVGQTMLNPDDTNPEILDPIDNPSEPILITETHTPSFINYWTYDEIDMDVVNFNNYGNLDPYIVNPELVTPHVINTDVINPHVINPHVINPHVINPHVINIAPAGAQNSNEVYDIQEAIFELTNYGNTTSSYSLRTYPLEVEEAVFEQIKDKIQIIVAKVSTSPSYIGCELAEEEHHELVANVTTPHVINTTQSAGVLDTNNMDPIDSDLYLNPGERAYIIYRVYIPEGVVFDLSSIFPNLIADAADGDGSLPSSAILITGASLPDGVEGESYPPYDVELMADGLTGGEVLWEFVDPSDPNDPPDWIQISSVGDNGVLSPVEGKTPTVGTYNLTVRVSNTVNGQIKQVATRTFTIRIATKMEVDLNNISLPDGYIGWPYNGSIPISGGTGPYTWEIIEGALPPGLTIGSSVTGTPEHDSSVISYPEEYIFIIRVSDSANPSQFIELEESITIAGIKKFGGTGDQEANDVVLDDDGNIYVAGYTTNGSHKDFYTAKFSSGGVLIWEETYDGGLATPGDDMAVAIALDADGVYVTGPSQGDGTSTDYATIGYDRVTGTPLWGASQAEVGGLEIQNGAVRYNGPGNSDDIPVAILARRNHVYVTGSSWSENTGPDFYTVRYDNANGEVKDEARYDGPSHLGDYPKAMIYDSGDIYVTGFVHRGNKTEHADYCLVKYDRFLNEEWDNTWDSRGNGIDRSNAVAVDSEGNVIITGESKASEETDFDYFTAKYNISGKKMLWDAREDQTFGDDFAVGVAVDDSNNVYVVGYSTGENNDTDFYIIGYDSDGNRLESHSKRIMEDGDDVVVAMATSVNESGDFCIYLTGYGENGGDTDVLTVKYNTDTGEIQKDRFDIGDLDQATSIVIQSDGTVYVAGYTLSDGEDRDFFILKYASDIGTAVWKVVK